MEQARVVPIATLSLFDIPGNLISVEELKRGHINRTYVGVWEHGGVRKRYVHQVVNHRIFQDIEGMMSNLLLVTDAPAIQAIVSGGMGFERAEQLGLVRLYGSAAQVGAVQAWLGSAN